MKGTPYGEAEERKYGDDGHYRRIRFYCIEGRFHIRHETKYPLPSGGGALEEKFSDWTSCDGSCQRSIPLPAALEERIREAMLTKQIDL